MKTRDFDIIDGDFNIPPTYVTKICFMCDEAVYIEEYSLDEICHIDSDIKRYMRQNDNNHSKKHERFLKEMSDRGYPDFGEIHKVLKGEYPTLYEPVMEYHKLRKIHYELTKEKRYVYLS